jgi:hypothetical protein
MKWKSFSINYSYSFSHIITMYLLQVTFLLLPLVSALPTIPFPPSPDLTQGIVSTDVSILAGGGLPNTTNAQQSVAFSPAGITALQLLASLENIEAYFYAQAIHNLTTGVYNVPEGVNLNNTVEIISKIAAVSQAPPRNVGNMRLIDSSKKASM